MAVNEKAIIEILIGHGRNIFRITEKLEDSSKFIPWCVEPIVFEGFLCDGNGNIVVTTKNLGFLHDTQHKFWPKFTEFGNDFNEVITWERNRMLRMFDELEQLMARICMDSRATSMLIDKTNNALNLGKSLSTVYECMRAVSAVSTTMM